MTTYAETTNSDSWNAFLEKSFTTHDAPVLNLDWCKNGTNATICMLRRWQIADLKTTAHAMVYGVADPGESTQFSKLRYELYCGDLVLKKGNKTKKFENVLAVELKEIRPRMTLKREIVDGWMRTMPPKQEGSYLECIIKVGEKDEEEKKNEDPQE